MQPVQLRRELVEAEDGGAGRRQAHPVGDVEVGEHRDRAHGHSRGGERPEQRAAGAPAGERAQLGDPLVVEPVVAAAQEAREVEGAHFLRRVAAHEHVLEVVALPLVRRHPAREVVEVARVERRDDPERDVADDDEGEQQRLEGGQREDEADSRNRRADDPEQAVDGLQRAELALGPRPLKPVVELRRFEREQVDPRGDVQHAVDRPAADELSEHTALLALDRAREVERDRDRDQRDENRSQVPEVGARAGVQHGLEHLLGDEELDDDADRRSRAAAPT